jgi:hypothetical protein
MKKNNNRCRECGHIQKKHSITIPGGFRQCEVRGCKCKGFRI